MRLKERGARIEEARWRSHERGYTSEVDPLNQTLSFQEGEELKLRDWSEVRRGWSQRIPQTLLDALANMEVNSVYYTAVEAGEEAAGRRQWADDPPDTLLKDLVQAKLTSSTLDSVTADYSRAEEEEEKRKEEEEDSDVEMDEERTEPRSDDDDTNFEESEDELREAVADSMKNLFMMEDGSLDEGEHTEEKAAAVDDGMEENADGVAVSAADSHQVQPEVEDSHAEITSNEPEECDGQSEHSDDNTTLKTTYDLSAHKHSTL